MEIIPKFKHILARKKKQLPGKKRPVKKKLPCLPSPCSGDDGFRPGMVMFILLNMWKRMQEFSTRQKGQDKLLQEIKTTLAEKVKPNQCNLQGPMSIEHLQISGGGSNTMNIHGPVKKRKRHESDQQNPGNDCGTPSSTPSHVLSEDQNNCNRLDADDEVDSETVQYDQEKNVSYVATNFDQCEQNCVCYKSDDKAESDDGQGGLVDGDGGCLDGQKQKVNGYQRNQVRLIGDDMNVCLADSDVDYGGGCNASRPDDMSDIDEGGVVSGLPDNIDGGIVPGPIDDGPNSSEVSFSEDIGLSDEKEHSQSVGLKSISWGQDRAVKAGPVMDDGSNKRNGAVAEMSQGLIADNNVNPQLVEGFEVPGREADPAIGYLTIRRGEVVCKEMSDGGDSVGMEMHSYGGEGSCSDNLSGPLQVGDAVQESELVVNSFKKVEQSLHCTLHDLVHAGNDTQESEAPANVPGFVQMDGDVPGDERSFPAYGLGSGVLGGEGSVSATLCAGLQDGKAMKESKELLSDLVSAKEDFGIQQPERILPAAVHWDSFSMQIDESFPASISDIVKSGTNDSLAEIDDRGTERTQSSTFPCLAAADNGMATSKGSVYTALSEPKQYGDGMKWMKRSLSASLPNSMRTGNGMKESGGGFSAAKPQSWLAGYGMEEPDQSQKIGFPGCVETGNRKPKGNDKPDGNEPWGSFAASDSGMSKVQVSEGHHPVLSDSVQGCHGTARIEGSICSPTLPLPVQAGDGMEGSDDCATSSDSGLSGFGTKETAGSLSAALAESGRPVLE